MQREAKPGIQLAVKARAWARLRGSGGVYYAGALVVRV